MLVFINLATGFRGLLHWGMAIVVIFNSERILKIGLGKLSMSFSLMVAFFVLYEVARASDMEVCLLKGL
jgi:hypothetical protein